MPKRRTAKPKTEFARRLIRVRESYGIATGRPDMDQKEFAMILGYSEEQVETYRRYERGETEPPLRVLAQIHRTTGASLDDLIGNSQRPFREKPDATRPGNVEAFSPSRRVKH